MDDRELTPVRDWTVRSVPRYVTNGCKVLAAEWETTLADVVEDLYLNFLEAENLDESGREAE